MSFNLTIDWKPFETDFRGHKITMELRPLKRWATMLLTPIYLEAANMKASKKKTVTADEANFSYRIQEIGLKIFPDHVRNLNGLQINNVGITIDDLCDESIFSPIVMEIMGELSTRSQLIDDEVKN